MNSLFKRIPKFLLCAALCLTLFSHGIPASAITTKFMVPTISPAINPDNCIYKSPNLNIMVCKWGYGLTADLLNTSSVDALLAELHSNVSAVGYKQAILGIYMEGAGLSDANVNSIANAGWTKLELYYDTFMISGNVPSGAMTPSITKASDEELLHILANAGINGDAAAVRVSGAAMTRANFILYEPEFSFLKGKNLYSYKFIPDFGVFVPIEESFFGSYAANFLELYDLQAAEADINGLYVTLSQSLPDTLVISAEDLTALRAAPPAPVPKTITSSAQTVQWTFANGQEPEGFTAEAVITPVNQTDVSVDFAYSGALPEGTEVSVQIPQEETTYSDGMVLYLYFCNPDTQMRDFTSQGIYQNGLATFQIEHCSEYRITSEHRGDSYPFETVQPSSSPEESLPSENPGAEVSDPPAEESPEAPEPVPEQDAQTQPGLTPLLTLALPVLLCVIAAIFLFIFFRRKRK